MRYKPSTRPIDLFAAQAAPTIVGMFIAAIYPIIVLLLGILLWNAPASYPKIADAGRGLFFIGAFFTVWALAKVTLRLP